MTEVSKDYILEPVFEILHFQEHQHATSCKETTKLQPKCFMWSRLNGDSDFITQLSPQNHEADAEVIQLGEFQFLSFAWTRKYLVSMHNNTMAIKTIVLILSQIHRNRNTAE